MQRCAVFVDAGYLLVAGGVLYCGGASDRRYVACDYLRVAEALRQFAETHANMPLLRIYWYDGAPNAMPQRDHLTIAALPHVKLRLGRLVRGEQKGVDSLVVRDLMVLARERAIVTAYLFGGDEDLREGVAEAQDMGVRVVVIGLKPVPQAQPADSLIHEADEFVELPDALLSPCFHRTTPAVAAVPVKPVPAAPTTPATAAATAAATPATTPTPTSVAEIGKMFAKTWLAQSSTEEIDAVAKSVPYLPPYLDRQLIFLAQGKLGSLFDKADTRRELRNAFHDKIAEHLRKASSSP